MPQTSIATAGRASTLMSAQRVADRLGVTKPTVFAMCERGELRGMRVEGSDALVFRADDVERVARVRAAALRRRAEQLEPQPAA